MWNSNRISRRIGVCTGTAYVPWEDASFLRNTDSQPDCECREDLFMVMFRLPEEIACFDLIARVGLDMTC